MTYKPNSETLDIIMPIARKLGIFPNQVIELLIKQAAKDYQQESKTNK